MTSTPSSLPRGFAVDLARSPSVAVISEADLIGGLSAIGYGCSGTWHQRRATVDVTNPSGPEGLRGRRTGVVGRSAAYRARRQLSGGPLAPGRPVISATCWA